eukprot:284816877_1
MFCDSHRRLSSGGRERQDGQKSAGRTSGGPPQHWSSGRGISGRCSLAARIFWLAAPDSRRKVCEGDGPIIWRNRYMQHQQQQNCFGPKRRRGDSYQRRCREFFTFLECREKSWRRKLATRSGEMRTAASICFGTWLFSGCASFSDRRRKAARRRWFTAIRNREGSVVGTCSGDVRRGCNARPSRSISKQQTSSRCGRREDCRACYVLRDFTIASHFPSIRPNSRRLWHIVRHSGTCEFSDDHICSYCFPNSSSQPAAACIAGPARRAARAAITSSNCFSCRQRSRRKDCRAGEPRIGECPPRKLQNIFYQTGLYSLASSNLVRRTCTHPADICGSSFKCTRGRPGSSIIHGHRYGRGSLSIRVIESAIGFNRLHKVRLFPPVILPLPVRCPGLRQGKRRTCPSARQENLRCGLERYRDPIPPHQALHLRLESPHRTFLKPPLLRVKFLLLKNSYGVQRLRSRSNPIVRGSHGGSTSDRFSSNHWDRNFLERRLRKLRGYLNVVRHCRPLDVLIWGEREQQYCVGRRMTQDSIYATGAGSEMRCQVVLEHSYKMFRLISSRMCINNYYEYHNAFLLSWCKFHFYPSSLFCRNIHWLTSYSDLRRNSLSRMILSPATRNRSGCAQRLIGSQQAVQLMRSAQAKRACWDVPRHSHSSGLLRRSLNRMVMDLKPKCCVFGTQKSLFGASDPLYDDLKSQDLLAPSQWDSKIRRNLLKLFRIPYMAGRALRVPSTHHRRQFFHFHKLEQVYLFFIATSIPRSPRREFQMDQTVPFSNRDHSNAFPRHIVFN